MYQKVPRLLPQTANGWNYMNECAALESRERRHSVCQVASLFEHWELHNTRVCHHVCLYICDFSTDVKLEQRANIKFRFKLGNSGAETFEVTRRAYGNEAMRRVSSGTRASREAEHHSKTTRGQGDLPRAQHQKCGNNLVSCA